jgi:hypothetical protein
LYINIFKIMGYSRLIFCSVSAVVSLTLLMTCSKIRNSTLAHKVYIDRFPTILRVCRDHYLEQR